MRLLFLLPLLAPAVSVATGDRARGGVREASSFRDHKPEGPYLFFGLPRKEAPKP